MRGILLVSLTRYFLEKKPLHVRNLRLPICLNDSR